MAQVHLIRKMYFEEGKTISAIAEATGYDRKTVRKYLEKEDFNQGIPKVTPDEPAFPSLEPFKATIQEWLQEDRRAKRKQRHTAYLGK